MKCGSGGSTNINRFYETKQQEVTKLLPTLANVWQKPIVELITSHPTVYISAGCDIMCHAANFATRTTNAANKVYNYTISRQTVTRSLLKQGQLAKLQFQKLFQNMEQDPECAISGIAEFWSARQTYLLPYGGIFAYGLNQSWEWITFPLSTGCLKSKYTL